ncbi:MAG TPA: type II secretion system protein GspM [Burkholderiaceae bacterium]|nr:type II secretion system protein GspM [Burkholderiaceae bacterium]
MNSGALSVPAPVVQLRARIVAWWRALAPRERQGAWLALALVAIAGGWFIAVQPALRTLNTAPATIDKLDAELQQMQLLATESRALRAAPPVAPATAAAALQAAAARLGAKAKLVQQGDRATLSLTAVDGEALRSLLAEVRSTARARPIEAQLVRSKDGYDGTLVLAVGGPT